MRAANPASVPLDRRRGVDDLKLVAVFENGNVAPSGFQHLVQPQAWLCATSPLMPTLTGLSLHLQTSVPPAKLPEPFFTPLSIDGWI
jgi:hypothetical protein